MQSIRAHSRKRNLRSLVLLVSGVVAACVCDQARPWQATRAYADGDSPAVYRVIDTHPQLIDALVQLKLDEMLLNGCQRGSPLPVALVRQVEQAVEDDRKHVADIIRVSKISAKDVQACHAAADEMIKQRRTRSFQNRGGVRPPRP
jgi:hypothetical protein